VTVALAHQASSAAKDLALREAAREALLRQTDLAVLHIVESLDLDVADAYRRGLTDDIEAALAELGARDVSWQLQLDVGDNNVAEKILELTDKVGAEVLVIGGRRRSPVGKLILGSVTQTLILEANVPVLVVKTAGSGPA
jgi:nucleotide-binding universal stress UspA family protein